jgi:hypothetical protein
MRQSPRYRRLLSDERCLRQLKAASSIFDFAAYTNDLTSPPEAYLFTFHGRGLSRPEGCPDALIRQHHQVLVRLGAAYPRQMPELFWKTPIFHPNISSSGIVCLGGYSTYWVPSLRLDQLCEMLWDMVRYENYDVESPYNREAAQWARTQTAFTFPLDPRQLRLKSPPPPSEADGSIPVAAEICFMDDALEIVDAELVLEPEESGEQLEIVYID